MPPVQQAQPMKQNQRVAIALFACLVLWCGWQSKYSSSAHPIKEPEASTSKNQQSQWEKWREPITIVTVLLVIVGLGQLGLFWRQLTFIRDSLGDAKKAAEAAKEAADAAKISADHIPRVERAYLFLALTIKQDLREYSVSTNETHSTIKFNFHNHGRTPAIMKELHGMAKYLPGQQWPAMAIAGKQTVQTGVVVSGNSTISEDDYSIKFSLTKQEREAAAAGKGRILFWGKIIYSDVFGNSRETGWCRQFHEDKEARDAGGAGFYFGGDETLNYYT
jgi:hypothetical protein